MNERGAVNYGSQYVSGAGIKRGEDVARWCGRGGHVVFDLKCRRRAVGAVIGGAGVGVDFARGDVEAEDGALEDFEGGFGLVGGDFVPSLVDAREGEVAMLPHLAADVAAVGLDVLVPSGMECCRLAVVDRKRVCFAADPYTQSIFLDRMLYDCARDFLQLHA